MLPSSFIVYRNYKTSTDAPYGLDIDLGPCSAASSRYSRASKGRAVFYGRDRKVRSDIVLDPFNARMVRIKI